MGHEFTVLVKLRYRFNRSARPSGTLADPGRKAKLEWWENLDRFHTFYPLELVNQWVDMYAYWARWPNLIRMIPMLDDWRTRKIGKVIDLGNGRGVAPPAPVTVKLTDPPSIDTTNKEDICRNLSIKVIVTGADGRKHKIFIHQFLKTKGLTKLWGDSFLYGEDEQGEFQIP
jgi:hypothetical protein